MTQILKVGVVLVLAVIAFGLTQGATQPPNVSITDLGTLPSGCAMGFNAPGQIVGGRTSISGSQILTHAARWQDGMITDLEALPDSIYSLAYAINDRGEIVGACITGS